MKETHTMRHTTVDDARRERKQSGDLYHEFLRIPAMSAGLYELAVGATDPQEPHTEDEVYYIVSGRATITVDGEDIPVAAGSLVYVPANLEHRFHDITEALAMLVFFAPAEYSQRVSGSVG